MKVAGGFKQDEGVRSLTSSLFLNPLLAVIVNILCSEGGQPFLSSKHCGWWVEVALSYPILGDCIRVLMISTIDVVLYIYLFLIYICCVYIGHSLDFNAKDV